MMPTRRSLPFTDLDQAVAEAESLHARGYSMAGQWDLGKICDHMCTVIELPMDGFGEVEMPWYMRLVKPVLGPMVMRRIMSTNRMIEGAPSLPKFLPPTVRPDEATCVKHLRDAVARFKQFNGTLHPHPFFGPMTKEQVNHVQALHAGHHLGFLVPN